MVKSMGIVVVKLFCHLSKFIRLIYVQDTSIKRKVIIAMALTLCISCFSMGLPLVFSSIIQLFADHSVSLSWLIWVMLLGYAIIWTMSQLTEHIRMMVNTYILERSARILSLRLFDHLHSLSLRFHLNRQTGAVLHILDRAQFGLESLFWGLFLYAVPVMIELLIALMVFGYFFGLVWVFFAILGICGYLYLNLILIEKTSKLYTHYNQKRSDASAKLLDSLLNVETVRYFCNQRYDYEQCRQVLTQQEQLGITKYRIEMKIQILQSLMIGLIIAVITCSSGLGIISGKFLLGQFVLINSYLLQLISPLRGFAHVLHQIRKGIADITAVNELFALQPEIKDASDAQVLIPRNHEIRFNSVSFGYDPERTILNNVSFSVPAGKTIALVGPSGVGKSTITRLLFRFYDVWHGSIEIDGRDIRSVTQQSLHQALGIVPQDTILFNDTLYYNIAYGNPLAAKEHVELVVRAAQLDHFIATLPEGYNTIVGERGLKLSGGERQRVAMARVLLKNPSIYIFDEATSALDSHTEQEILKTMRTAFYGATTIIIAHRLSTVMHADEILVFDQGTIIERGTHDQLLNAHSRYAYFWHKQNQIGTFSHQ